MEFWQEYEPAAPHPAEPFTRTYPAEMPDGTRLRLPLRDLGATAVAGLIVNQTSFAVLDRLIEWLVEVARPLGAGVVVGLPTLGHGLAAGVASGLGHANWVALGTSRKLWYEPALSVPLASITSPGEGRRLWLDPNLLTRLRGKRVLVVDDVISTGASAGAALALLQLVDVRPVALCAAMLQGGEVARQPAAGCAGAGGVSPRRALRAVPGGWRRIAGSERRADCPLLPPRAAD